MKYFYLDNWTGARKEFSDLCEAKESAKKETGESVAIHDEKGNIVCFAEASHFVYP